MIRRFLLVPLVIFFSVVPTLGAQVDQEHWDLSKISGGYSSGMDLRQEFTPTLNALDSVELSVAQGIMRPQFDLPGLVAVNILQGGARGPVIAASLPTYLPPRYSGSVLCQFAEPVRLIPGQLYALQPFALTEGATWAFDVTMPHFSSGYPGGRLSIGERYFAADDLLFREGIGIPEPSPSMLLACGVALLLAVVRSRTRKTALLVLVGHLSLDPVTAHVDQDHGDTNALFYTSFSPTADLQQEFTPTLDAFDT